MTDTQPVVATESAPAQQESAPAAPAAASAERAPAQPAGVDLYIVESCRSERADKGQLDQKTLVYGEVDFHSFCEVLSSIMPPAGGTFYDLGSGTGRAIFVAAFVQDFVRLVGIEILDGLYEASTEVLDRFRGGGGGGFRSLLDGAPPSPPDSRLPLR